MEKSKNLYFKVYGEYALWTSADSKGGGEKATYLVPTRQGLHGIVDSIYFKPTFVNKVDEVIVMNQIITTSKGVRTSVKNGTAADLSYYTYLENPCYYVKYHFEWNDSRTDLTFDRNLKKHEAIAERSILKGGRRDIFLGTRECLAYVEPITEHEYEKAQSFYGDEILSFGIMFHSFQYPTISGNPLKSYFSDITMINGKITFKPQSSLTIVNTLSDYNFKYGKNFTHVEEEMYIYREEENS